MQQRQRHSSNDALEPEIGDLVRISGKEWFGHPMMMSLGLVIDKQDKTGEPVECACLVLVQSVKMWIYISDLDVEARATPTRSVTM